MKTKRIRTTITVTEEVHQVFTSMATVSGQSISRCIGDWLESTADGAQFVTYKIKQAKHSPSEVMRDLHQASVAFNAETLATFK